jgi:hypothetical protein
MREVQSARAHTFQALPCEVGDGEAAVVALRSRGRTWLGARAFDAAPVIGGSAGPPSTKLKPGRRPRT